MNELVLASGISGPNTDGLCLGNGMTQVLQLFEIGHRRMNWQNGRAGNEILTQARDRHLRTGRVSKFGLAKFCSIITITLLVAQPIVAADFSNVVLNSIRFRTAEDMSEIDDGSAQLVIMGPPYMGVKQKERIQDKELLRKSILEAKRVLRPDGVLVIGHTDYKANGGMYWRHDVIREIAETMGLELFDHKLQVWSLRRNDFRRTVRNVLLFRKQKKIKKHPTADYYSDAWIQVVTQKMGDFRDAYSPDLVRILVESFSDKKDLVISQFAGSGTTVAVALQMGRRSVGYELNNELRPVIRQRAATIGSYFQSSTDLITYVIETELRKASPEERSKICREIMRQLKEK